ncbi:MAG: lytic transglycosylase domain-containing protein [Gemmatimonadota bacterium]
MSAENLRGLRARVDGRDSTGESLEYRRAGVSRPRWLGPILTMPLLAIVFIGARPDPVTEDVPLEPLHASQPAVPSIPLEVNDRVERWMTAFETTRREEFEFLLRKRDVYAPMIRAKLRERGMPEELIYIPMIESEFSALAVSHVSAVGLWQFMSPTAMQYGLRVDEYVDERRDPVAATDAALDYLAWLHDRFGGSWYLAAAAFNAGPGRMERILNRHADGRFSAPGAYWDVLDYLPRETREYVPKMIAVTVLANDADQIGFDAGDVQPYVYDNVFVPGETTLEQVAATLDLAPRALYELNPHLIRGVTPPYEMYGVRVPVGTGSIVIDGLTDRPMPFRRTDD